MVYIVGQSGSTEKDVVMLLGEPYKIVSNSEMNNRYGFRPQPPICKSAKQVYIYNYILPSYWVAYIYLNSK